MKLTSQTTECIACGSRDATLSPMAFMGERAQFPICAACAPYVPQVFGDPSFGPAYILFLGVTSTSHSHQQGGAFSAVAADRDVPEDLAARMADFDLYCTFVGRRIRALRSIATPDA